MRRTELVNMIKVVRLLGFPELSAYLLPRSAISHCFVTTVFGGDSQTLWVSTCELVTGAHDQEEA